MKTRLVTRLGVAVGAATLLLGVACTNTNDLRTESRTFQRNEATSARVNVEMGAGKLRLEGSNDELARADFRYNVDKWKPVVDYAVTSGVGALTIRQPDSNGFSFNANVTNEWDLRLNNEIPTDLTVDLGAGTSELALGGMALTALTVHTGAGETFVDLTGTWHQNLQAKIEGGAGKLVVRLPQDIGARIDAEAGIGTVEADGFTRQGGAWVNGAYGASPVTLHIVVEAGVGEVNLVLGD
jgi:hypothetical protein